MAGEPDPIFDLSHIDPDSPTADVEGYLAGIGLGAKIDGDLAAWIENSVAPALKAAIDRGADGPEFLRSIAAMLRADADIVDPDVENPPPAGA
ncbi:MAG: hypothetical protein JWL73_3707 [Actinomycetia bacterium]|nr:hypothetical protein [Actinomycetes bacterium]